MTAERRTGSLPLLGVLADGWRRTLRARWLVVALWLVTILVTLPLAVSVGQAIAEQLGASLDAGTMADGADYDWLQEFNEQSTGAAASLTADVIGFAAVLDNASAFLDLDWRPLLVFAAMLSYPLSLTFLAGGCLDRLARDRPVPAHAFFSACGAYFPRFLRLAVGSGAAYALIIGLYGRWIFGDLAPRLTRDMTAERSVFFVQVAGYIALLVPLFTVNLLFDYAKVRTVVEDRRSMIGALIAAAAFLRRNIRRALALYLLDGLFFFAILAAYAAAAPGAGGVGLSMWGGFVIGQLYIAARGWVKLLFWATEIAFFQGRFAHAGYVRRPLPEWPESPAAEALAR